MHCGLGLRQAGGLRRDDAARIVAARDAPCRDVAELCRRAGISSRAVETLVAADAFGSMGFVRRQALWQARALGRGGAVAALRSGGPVRGRGPSRR